MMIIFLLRAVFGTIGLYLCNTLLSALDIGIYMGINFINLLTIGSLGVSGFLLVFAISVFAIL